MNIIITGASRGIGYEAVKIFAGQAGNQVIAIARSCERLEELAASCRGAEFPGTVTGICSDLSEENIRKLIIPEISGRFRRVDVLVNNAGLLVNKSFNDLSGADFDALFNTNVKGPFLLIRELLPFFNEGSHILNIGSMGGYQGSAKFSGLSLYSASKGALAILTECLAEEFKDKKIRVNCLALGSAQTEMLEQAFPGYRAPLSASEMAGFVADFAMRGHLWFNGKILPVSLATP
jgi:NAD(P)-dependent dehydrogenase (short-subunit alcohol dehydrogenase family)